MVTIDERNKWRTSRENLVVGQLVLVRDAEDLSKRGAYRLGRIHRVHPQLRVGKEIVRRATVAVPKKQKKEKPFLLVVCAYRCFHLCFVFYVETSLLIHFQGAAMLQHRSVLFALLNFRTLLFYLALIFLLC